MCIHARFFTGILSLGALISSFASPVPVAAATTDKLWCQVKSGYDGMELAVWAADTQAGQQAAATSCGYAISLGFYGISSATPASGRTRACAFLDEGRGVQVEVWYMNDIANADANAGSWCYDEAVTDNFTVVWPDGSVTPPGGP